MSHARINKPIKQLDSLLDMTDAVVKNVLLHHLDTKPEGEEKAFAQIRAMQEKATNYDVVLMPELTVGQKLDNSIYSQHKPTLIKHFNASGDIRISLWGDLNGRWQLTELNNREQALFSHIHFPPSGSGSNEILGKQDITLDMFAALKIGHTISQYALSEFTRNVAAFLQKYFPAWIAQLWCLATHFPPELNFANLITLVNSGSLKLHYGEDFYSPKLGKDFSIFKGKGGAARWYGGRPMSGGNWEILRPVGDLAAMTDLCQQVKVEFEEINEKCLAFENLQEISSESNRPSKL